MDARINADERLIGSVVGDRYLVTGVLGRGVTGTAFAVEHRTLSRRAVLKLLRAQAVAVDEVSRVVHRDAHPVWGVTHPSLPEILDAGMLPDGTPFVVTEFLDGETLAQKLSRERLSLAASVDVFMQMLSACDALHARGLLLVDLRPQNVFLAHRRGCRPLVKLLDVGLARLFPLDAARAFWDSHRVSHPASSHVAMPHYVSPEMARGERELSQASDLFVLTTIFYEAITGHRPFVGTTFRDVLDRIEEGRPAPLQAIRPELPDALWPVVAGALSPIPTSRPRSARELQDALRAAFEGGARPMSLPVVAPQTTLETATVPRISPTPPGTEPLLGAHAPLQTYDDETGAEWKPTTLLRRPDDVPLAIAVAPSTTSAIPKTSTNELPTVRASEDEETETLHLSDDARARIEAMLKKG